MNTFNALTEQKQIPMKKFSKSKTLVYILKTVTRFGECFFFGKISNKKLKKM